MERTRGSTAWGSLREQSLDGFQLLVGLDHELWQLLEGFAEDDFPQVMKQSGRKDDIFIVVGLFGY